MKRGQSGDGRYRKLFELSPKVVLILDPADGAIVDANPQALSLYGWAPQELRQHRYTEVDVQPSEAVLTELAQACVTAHAHVTARHASADGSLRDVEVFYCRLQEEDGRTLLGAIIHDVTERNRMERELVAALQVVEASPVVGFRWRATDDWPVEYVSANVSRWGYRPDDLKSGRIRYADLIHPDDLARVIAEVEEHTAKRNDAYVQEYRLRSARGDYFWVEDNTHIVRNGDGVPGYYAGVVTDINFKKLAELHLMEALNAQHALNRKLEEAQNQLIQADKLASIGQLAAGVAHEINNPIGFVSSNLGSLENYLHDLFAITDAYGAAEADAPPDWPSLRRAIALKRELDFDFLRNDIAQLLAESREGLARVAKIVKDLKDFSRAGDANWHWVDLHAGLDSTLNIVANELKYKCTVIKDYGVLPQVCCVPAQLNQVFMNLLVNAAFAIPDKGEITLRTGRQGDEVFVAICDTGVGIPAENLPRIFEPFFTTKPVGQGTGLGLSLAYSIVQKHRGRIEVASTPGRGSTFSVWLPIEPPQTN